MEMVAAEVTQHVPETRWCWRVAVTITVLVAVASLALTFNQVVINYLYDQNAHTRTLGGVLVMVLGVVGIGLPFLLFRNQRRFRSLRPSRQWLWAVGIPLFYMLILVLCAEASLRSTNLILPRPTLPTAVVQYQPGDSRVEFRGRWGGGGGRDDAEIQEGVEHFSSHIDQGFIDGFLPGAPHHPARRIITIVGRAQLPNPGTAQIVLDVDAVEAFQIVVENLDDVTMTREGQPVADSVLHSGKYQITISGRPKKVT